jgi:hypothetical protein
MVMVTLVKVWKKTKTKNIYYFVFKSIFIDVNECERDGSACDDNAICYNLLGHYECKCRAPYVGSGKECFFESACSACSTNAYCDTNADNVARCICNIGFYGNGYQCEPIRSPEGI